MVLSVGSSLCSQLPKLPGMSEVISERTMPMLRSRDSSNRDRRFNRMGTVQRSARVSKGDKDIHMHMQYSGR